MVWNIMSVLMSVIAFTGTIINAERSKVGFLFWLISNAYFSVRFFYIGEYSQGVLFALYFLWAIRGIYVWRKKEKKERESKKKYNKIKKQIDSKIKEYEDNFKKDIDVEI